MMRKLPDCPVCQERDLFLRRMGQEFALQCAECGWFSGLVTLEAGQDLDAAIAATVAAAQEAVDDAT